MQNHVKPALSGCRITWNQRFRDAQPRGTNVFRVVELR